MLITGDDRMSRLATCLVAAPNFLLDAKAAENLIADQIERIQAFDRKVPDCPTSM
jgi:serine/threonine-protein kinase HipA